MSGQIPRPKGSIALVATLVVWIVSFGASASSVHADDCLAGRASVGGECRGRFGERPYRSPARL